MTSLSRSTASLDRMQGSAVQHLSSQPSVPTITEQEWVERFASELLRLGTQAEPGQLFGLARQFWLTLGSVEPRAAARGEFDWLRSE